MAKQILLVDDSVTIHRVVELTFAHEDYKVTAVKTADEGLAKARDLKPDIVLADAGMTGKSGYDVCAALRADGALAATPILILTGNFSPYDEAKGQKAGADGFVVKPFETQAMIDKVADAINKKGARAGGPATAAPSAPTPIPATMASATPRAIDLEPPSKPLPVAPVAAPPPAPAPKPVPAPAAVAPTMPAAPRPATAPPTARTMMGMQAPTLPTAPTIAAPPPKPMQVEPLSKPLSVVAAETGPRAPAPSPPPPVAAPSPPASAPPSAAGSTPNALPREKVPQMPRPSLIPSVPTPAATPSISPSTLAAAASGKAPPPRATLMGMPAVNPANLPPGAVALPSPTAKPAAPWSPPANAPPPAVAAVPPPAPAPPSPPPPSHSPMVAAVTERAVGEIAARGPEYEAVAKLSREIIERIAWEIVPELAEVIIKEQLDRLVAERQK